MPSRRTTIADACRRPFMGRLLGAFGCFSVAEIGSWVAITALAHRFGGVTEVSIVLMVMLGPSMLFAASVGTLAHRWGTRRVLVWGLVVQGLGFVAASALAVSDAPHVATYAALLVSSVGMVTTRPTTIPLLPVVAPVPAELTAANVVLGWVEGVGLLVGPLITGAVLALADVRWTFVPFAAACLVGALVVGTGRMPVAATSGYVEESPTVGLSALVEVVRTPAPRAAVVVLGVQAFINGTIDVLYIVVAVDILGDRPADAGWLSAAFGVGALAGGVGASALVGARRIWTFSAAAGVALAAAVAVTGAVPALWVGLAVFFAAGVATTMMVVSTRTLLQRVASLELLSHTFSLVETAELAMLFVGAATFPAFVALSSIEVAPLLVALVAVGALAFSVPMLARSEASASVPPERIRLLAGVEALGLLPADALSALASASTEVSVAAGETLFREGDVGDAYYVVVSGRMAVRHDGRRVAHKAPGEGFGEYALVRDAARSATLVAELHSELLRITRESFLLAVLGHVPTLEAVESVAEGVHRDLFPDRPAG